MHRDHGFATTVGAAALAQLASASVSGACAAAVSSPAAALNTFTAHTAVGAWLLTAAGR